MKKTQALQKQNTNEETPQWINQCVYTKEALLTLQKVGQPAWIRVLLVILEIACLALMILFFASGNYRKAIQMLIGFLIVLFAHVGVPRLQVRTMLKRAMAKYNSLSQINAAFFETHILSHNIQSNAKSKVTYEQIIRVIETQNMYLLHVRPQSYILLDKQGFVQGTCEEFQTFLHKKIPHAIWKQIKA